MYFEFFKYFEFFYLYIQYLHFSLCNTHNKHARYLETIYYQKLVSLVVFSTSNVESKYIYIEVKLTFLLRRARENIVHVGKTAMTEVQERREKESNQQWFQAFLGNYYCKICGKYISHWFNYYRSYIDLRFVSVDLTTSF